MNWESHVFFILHTILHSRGQVVSPFNLIVLLASLCGAIISAFNVLVPVLEMRLGIASVWGAPVGKADVVRNWADTVTEHEQTIVELVAANAELRQRVERSDATVKIVYSMINRAMPGVLVSAVPAPALYAAHEVGAARAHNAIERFDGINREHYLSAARWRDAS